MWDVFSEMVVAAKDKVISVASYDLGRRGMSMLSKFFFQEAWKDMAQTLADANAGIANELLETERTIWLPDSAASACMLCNVRFHPIMCSRHHCRFCGGVFCGGCSKGRSLMPPKFNTSEPQRVCDVCGVRLESIQPYLINRISRASQPPTHDVTDLSTLRSWLNFPYAHTMEYEIYKAANSLNSYCKVCLFTLNCLLLNLFISAVVIFLDIFFCSSLLLFEKSCAYALVIAYQDLSPNSKVLYHVLILNSLYMIYYGHHSLSN
jgi:hypothetical protein